MPTRPVADLVDPRRTEPAYLLGEREMLEAWLDFHRATLLLKCEGLDDRQRKLRPVATSELSLHGLLRHLAEVERSWFQRCLRRQPGYPHLFGGPDAGRAWQPIEDADWAADLATWAAECQASRETAAGHSLDDTGLRGGEEVSLRWIYSHLVEE